MERTSEAGTLGLLDKSSPEEAALWQLVQSASGRATAAVLSGTAAVLAWPPVDQRPEATAGSALFHSAGNGGFMRLAEQQAEALRPAATEPVLGWPTANRLGGF